MNTRKVTEVACGVLVDRCAKTFLLGSRPQGKPYAGYWEFPGGKLEAGETVHEALARELKEELDLAIGPSYPWFVIEHDYPHAYVRLHFRRCFQWSGAPRSLEKQEFLWVHQGALLSDMKLLPMDALVVERIFLPEIIQTDRVDDLTRFSDIDPTRGAIVSNEAEMLRARDAGLAYAVAKAGSEVKLLRDQMNGLPIYVFADENRLDEFRAAGAHGVVSLRR